MRVELKTTFYYIKPMDVPNIDEGVGAVNLVHIEWVDIPPKKTQYKLLKAIQRMGELLGKESARLRGRNYFRVVDYNCSYYNCTILNLNSILRRRDFLHNFEV